MSKNIQKANNHLKWGITLLLTAIMGPIVIGLISVIEHRMLGTAAVILVLAIFSYLDHWLYNRFKLDDKYSTEDSNEDTTGSNDSPTGKRLRSRTIRTRRRSSTRNKN